MNLLPMLLAFTAACVVIDICLSKRQMKIARALFLAFGIIVVTCSLLLILADWQFSKYACMRQYSDEISSITTLLLSISALVFDVIAVVIVVATLILSVIAIKKIAEYIKSKRRTAVSAQSENQKPIAEPIFACARKIFVLHCRWNN